MKYEGLPFENETIKDGVVRTFSESIDDHELKWHVDEEDRIVKSLHETNWMIQLDNELPILLEKGKEIFIPKGLYHRVIKGNGDLKVSIKFI